MDTTELIIDTVNCFEDKDFPVTPELATEPEVEPAVSQEQLKEAEPIVEEPAKDEPPELVDTPDDYDSEKRRRR